MKRVFQTATVAVAIAGGLAIGFLIRKHRETARVAPDEVVQSGQSASTNRSSLQAAPALDDSPLATELEHQLTISKGVQRWLLWLETVEKAGPPDFPRLAKLARKNPAALRFVSARWAELAPRHLYDTLVAALRSRADFPVQELARTLFDQWPKKDPEAAIAALNEPGEIGPRVAWRDQVAESVIRTDAERGLRLFTEWHIENYGPSMGAISKWAAASPEHA